MECSSLIENTIKEGKINEYLFHGSTEKSHVVELQRLLYEMGFKKELNWELLQADGVYGDETAAAVRAFAKKNNIDTDGCEVNSKLAKLIVQRHSFLPTMYVFWSIHKSDLRKKIRVSQGTHAHISAIQVLLNELGYGKKLKFAKFGADGVYGKSTKGAIISFTSDNNIESDGDLITRPFINLILKKLNGFYGTKWSELAENYKPDDKSPLVIYEGDRFRGKPCQADRAFLPMLERINKYAEMAEVMIHVTSSFRSSTVVKGAIVKPSTTSNHLVGHGIDMNLHYGKKGEKFANSKVLASYPDCPKPVKAFLDLIINDKDLRWGGFFSRKDPVHIDDDLYNKNPRKWKKRYKELQEAVQKGIVKAV